MRLLKTDVIAGLPAPLAREVLRTSHRREIYHGHVTKLFDGQGIAPAVALHRLADAGLLELIRRDRDGDAWWAATVAGNSLAMASFGKPITRATADRLLAGVLERAADINANPEKIAHVARLRVFGSYLDPDVDRLGDIDLELTIDTRPVPFGTREAYARASGRRFRNEVERLFWPEREIVLILQNRSPAINLVREDVDELTDRVRTVYEFSPDGPVSG